jgi:hypothetical protein
MPVCGPVRRLPGPVAAGAPSGCPETGTSRLGLIGCPTSVSELAPFTLTRLPVPTPVTPGPNVSSGAVGVPPRCSTRCPAARDPRQAVGPVRRSARSAARRSRLPGRSSPRNSWLLIPSGAAPASWAVSVFLLQRPEGPLRKTRSLGPGWRKTSTGVLASRPTMSSSRRKDGSFPLPPGSLRPPLVLAYVAMVWPGHGAVRRKDGQAPHVLLRQVAVSAGFRLLPPLPSRHRVTRHKDE